VRPDFGRYSLQVEASARARSRRETARARRKRGREGGREEGINIQREKKRARENHEGEEGERARDTRVYTANERARAGARERRGAKKSTWNKSMTGQYSRTRANNSFSIRKVDFLGDMKSFSAT